MLLNHQNVKKRESNLKENVLPFEVVHIGEPASNMNTFHWHDFLEISLILDGCGVYEIEDKTFDVKKNDIIIINNIERHKVSYKPEGILFEAVLHFDPKLIWSRENSPFDYDYLKLFQYNGANFNNRPVLDEDSSRTIKSLITEIVHEYSEKKPCYGIVIKAKLLLVIALLIRQCNIQWVGKFDYIIKKNNIERLERILQYMEENFNDDLNLETIAKKFYMNSSYFSDYFKKNMGINFTKYLTKLKIGEAIRLINENNASLTEIAFMCGFNNISSFFIAFKRVTKMSPGEYKKNKINI